MSFYHKIFKGFSEKELARIKPIAKKVMALEPVMQAKTDEQLQAMTPDFKARLSRGESLDDIMPEAFAVCREAAWRVLGMKHYMVQIIGGIVLHRGYIAEMCTGEGKTLVGTLPVYLNALTGKGVHVVTVNDYLAQRDSEWMGKLYRWLGLSVGLVTGEVSPLARKKQYDADITYGTNNEFGFDYLRDNMAKKESEIVQRGHYFAIVDEVDSILIDEARTPLIISGPGIDLSQMYRFADQFAKTLKMSKITELDNKEEQDEQVDGDYVVDEKHKTATLTGKGVKKAEEFFGIENLTDMENQALAHYINQAIRAVGVMHKDVDYIVRDGEVVIVDEFTGRLMDGRRYNEGLHQAIEAKEGVEIAAENRTLASVTFQNYFRMYDKLSGMTGTASTEADEFREIYNLPIVTIPTNRPIQRIDQPDIVYKTEKAKYKAVLNSIKKHHSTGQPILVGTESVEQSEMLSKMLTECGIPHNVLNAKNHEREAEIVAQAGKKDAVTIATNMAGRGTDIKLGGNAEFMAKAKMREEGFAEEYIAEADGHADTQDENILAARIRFDELEKEMKPAIEEEAKVVRELGGLYVIATERSENRRIDNQLRGRAGRQGDPGESRFFLSLEDDLLRLFGGERATAIMNSLSIDDDDAIDTKLLSNVVANAQKRLETKNFEARKNVLQYDDVMDVQRKTIYEERNKALTKPDLSDEVHKMLQRVAEAGVAKYCADKNWDLDGLRQHFVGWLCNEDDFHYAAAEEKKLTASDLQRVLIAHGEDTLAKKKESFGNSVLQQAEHQFLLNCIDASWMAHMDNTEQLKKGIYLRSYGQHDPVIAYRIECFEMFDEMVEYIQESVIHTLMLVEVRQPAQSE